MLIMRNFYLVCALTALMTAAHTQGVTVLSTNYDIALSIEDHNYRVSSHALVRSGNEIPNLLQDYKVGLRISEVSGERFTAQVIIYEKNGSGWHQVSVPPPEFDGKLGTPTEYRWESAGIELDVAVIVGLYQQ